MFVIAPRDQARSLMLIRLPPINIAMPTEARAIKDGAAVSF
jgi:hypothetical protein